LIILIVDFEFVVGISLQIGAAALILNYWANFAKRMLMLFDHSNALWLIEAILQFTRVVQFVVEPRALLHNDSLDGFVAGAIAADEFVVRHPLVARLDE